MSTDTPGSGTGAPRYEPALTLAAAGAAAFALIVRCVSIAEPLGIDQSLWASAVRGMSEGQLLYRDVWEQRPPGIYFIYLAGFHLFGWASSTVAWLDIIASAATTILVYFIARRLAGRLTGAVAAALYATLTMPAWLYRNSGFLERSVCETFIVVCVSLSAWCAVKFRESGSLALAAGVGLFGGAAVVLKPNAGLYLPALLLWMAIYRGESGGHGKTAKVRLPPQRAQNARRGPRLKPDPTDGLDTRASVVRPIVAAMIAAAVLPAIALIWLWWLGLLRDAGVAVIEFNRFYVAQGFTLGGYAVDFSKAVWLRMKTDPLWLAGGVGSLAALWDLARRRRLPPLAGLAVLWGGAAALVIVVNGARLFNSYFIQAFPPLSVLAAWLLTENVRESAARRVLAVGTALLMLFVLAQRHYPAKVFESARADLDLLRGRVDRTTYLERFGGYGNSRGYSARANAELAAYVREHTAPADRIFLFGINGAGVYFAADRLTAQRFLRVNFFVENDFPDPSFRLEAVVDQLAARRPRYLIFERLNSPSAMGQAADSLVRHPAIIRLLSPYGLETQIEDFTLYRLQ
jgi:hypothetical protein